MVDDARIPRRLRCLKSRSSDPMYMIIVITTPQTSVHSVPCRIVWIAVDPALTCRPTRRFFVRKGAKQRWQDSPMMA